jgi:UDP-N-acetyl-D-galactosamine dehydrogenase
MLSPKTKIAVIGLGYVGLPLAVEFAKKFQVVGFDINQRRIDELSKGHDHTLEVDDDNLKLVINCETRNAEPETGLYLSTKPEDLQGCSIFIVTVPTPVDKNNRPDLTPLIRASETVGKAIQNGGIVIYESTVYPGCTEEDCIPVIEKVSGLRYQVDFYAGYSPERINPGDKEHTFTTIHKITSGSTEDVAEVVDQLYKSVVKAGTFKATSIKVAEMAKVIENSQRDINIAFVNEIARICSHFKIDSSDVLEAAGTKWNFLKFKPGLVGGHCIGVDPYYLAQKAQEAGYHPEIILAGRRMNDTMGAWIAGQIVKLMIRKDIPVNNCKVLVLGITFKENCPDIRNSKVIDVINELKSFGCLVDVYDPWANPDEVKHEYKIDSLSFIADLPHFINGHTTIVLAVAHNEFKSIDLSTIKPGAIIYDIKAFWPTEQADGRV